VADGSEIAPCSEEYDLFKSWQGSIEEMLNVEFSFFEPFLYKS